MYQAGVQAGQGLAQGIESQLGAVDAAIKNMAQSMVNTMKSALKSHSPSLVFFDLGYGTGAGAAMGVDQGAHLATAAVCSPSMPPTLLTPPTVRLRTTGCRKRMNDDMSFIPVSLGNKPLRL
jgi:hypothetical protein